MEVKNGIIHMNYHYDGFQGPTQNNPNLVPTLFKHPRSSSQCMATKRRRVLDRSGFSNNISDRVKESSEENEDLSEDTADVHMVWCTGRKVPLIIRVKLIV